MKNNKPKNKLKKSTQAHGPGFSLLEVSIALLLATLVLTAIVFHINKYMLVLKTSRTTQHLTNAKLALRSYFVHHKSLPVPEGGGMRLTLSGTSTLFGALPVEELNLPREAQRDGFANLISYYVVEDLTIQDLNFFSSQSGEGITADIDFTENSNDVIDMLLATGPSTTVEVPYIIISHGPNKAGAYQSISELGNAPEVLPIGGSLDEQNSLIQSNGSTKAISTFAYTAKKNNQDLDDIVVFESTQNLYLALKEEGSIRCREMTVTSSVTNTSGQQLDSVSYVFPSSYADRTVMATAPTITCSSYRLAPHVWSIPTATCNKRGKWVNVKELVCSSSRIR